MSRSQRENLNPIIFHGLASKMFFKKNEEPHKFPLPFNKHIQLKMSRLIIILAQIVDNVYLEYFLWQTTENIFLFLKAFILFICIKFLLKTNGIYKRRHSTLV